MKEKFLPIGSVVLLENGTKKVMITGFCITTPEKPDTKYDYCGCVYPEGIIKSDLICVFNHDQIKEISFIGFETEEESAFKLQLSDLLNEKEESTSPVFLKLDNEPEMEYL